MALVEGLTLASQGEMPVATSPLSSFASAGCRSPRSRGPSPRSRAAAPTSPRCPSRRGSGGDRGGSRRPADPRSPFRRRGRDGQRTLLRRLQRSSNAARRDRRSAPILLGDGEAVGYPSGTPRDADTADAAGERIFAPMPRLLEVGFEPDCRSARRLGRHARRRRGPAATCLELASHRARGRQAQLQPVQHVVGEVGTAGRRRRWRSPRGSGHDGVAHLAAGRRHAAGAEVAHARIHASPAPSTSKAPLPST